MPVLGRKVIIYLHRNIAPDTLCIPLDYSSYIRPISYQNMHRKIPQNARQIYYTVYFGNYYSNFVSQ